MFTFAPHRVSSAHQRCERSHAVAAAGVVYLFEGHLARVQRVEQLEAGDAVAAVFDLRCRVRGAGLEKKGGLGCCMRVCRAPLLYHCA
jgi:hypothetical protein